LNFICAYFWAFAASKLPVSITARLREAGPIIPLSAPQNSSSTVVEGSMEVTSANDPERNATGELKCTIQYLFRS
jgi:hypothetical protein